MNPQNHQDVSNSPAWMEGWSFERFAMFRIILGAYLFYHFAALLPFAAELFSAAGMMPAAASPLTAFFPNPLAWFDTPGFATLFVGFGVALSLALITGKGTRVVAFLLWFVWACLFGRNPLIANPGIPFVGWLLLMISALPVTSSPEWRLPRSFFTLTWAIMALGYTFSGATKLISPSWIDGSALFHILESPLARPSFFREWLVSQPELLRAMSYGVLCLEVLTAPLAAFRRFRPWIWGALVSMHLGILVTVDFADLTLGMLMIHLITFNPDWLPDAWVLRAQEVSHHPKLWIESAWGWVRKRKRQARII